MDNQNINTETDQGYQVSRRDFLVGAGAVIAGTMTFGIFYETPRPLFSYDNPNHKAQKLTAWVQITKDDKVIIYQPSSEMGQGSKTACPLILAEEMDADWSKVIVENSPIEIDPYGNPGWGRPLMLTAGSRTIMGLFTKLRLAGAQARKTLMTIAASEWEVPVAEVTTRPGVVIHTKSKKKMTFGQIAGLGKTPKKLPSISEKELKDPKKFRLIGVDHDRVDIPGKVDGSAKFAIDVEHPNMVYAMITRSPVHGGGPKSFNKKEIQAMKDIEKVVALDHGVAVIGKSMFAVMNARKKLKVTWKKGAKAENFDSEKAFVAYGKAVKNDSFPANNIHQQGNPKIGQFPKGKSYSQEYKADHIYHCQMEPLNAVARFVDGKLEMWAGTQAPWILRNSVARAMGISLEKMILHPCYLGGGFGRRSYPDYPIEAARLAKAAGKPVKLVWSREDDLTYGMFRPQNLQRLEGEVDEKGKLQVWRHSIAGSGGRLLTSGIEIHDYYDIPNQHIDSRIIESGLRLKHFRSVGHGYTKWAIEAFIDEIAADQGVDPLDFRRKLLQKSPRPLACLEAVAKVANWKKKRPKGRALGFSLVYRSNSWSAAIAEISVDRKTGKITVHKVWSSLDAGIIVQPKNTITQMEGGIIHGLSTVLKEQVTYKNGEIQQSNFHDYQILTADECPHVEVELIKSTEPPTGVGESGLPLAGAAVSNAFFKLTGKKLLHMPFTPERVLQALKS